MPESPPSAKNSDMTQAEAQMELAAGDRVRVREDYPPGHMRTPVYVRGKEGVVARALGRFRNPEALAIGKDGLPKKALYEVHFRQKDLWPDYDGPESDILAIDIYEHWLTRI
jgi:nitrile hydratase subunit beta